jgi:hypothetical protein
MDRERSPICPQAFVIKAFRHQRMFFGRVLAAVRAARSKALR